MITETVATEARTTRMGQLGALAAGHALVDMYGSFFIPLLPALVIRLHTTDAKLAAVAATVGIVVNLVQPLTGAFIHRLPAPLFLWLGPLLALGFALLGMVHTLPQLALLAITAAIGVGIFHPAALLGAHVAAGRRERLGIPIFLSGGAFGVAIGSVLVTQWVARTGFDTLWWLALPGAALLLGLFLSTGIARLDIHRPLPPPPEEAAVPLPFAAVFAVGSLLAINITMLFTYFPFHLKSFLGERATSWGGLTLCAISLTGALGSYCWGAVGHRVHPLRLLAIGQCILVPLLLLLLHTRDPRHALLLSVAIGGFTSNAFFPQVAALARRAVGLTPGLRAGLIVGGAWGVGSLATLAGAALLAAGATPAQVILATIPTALLAGVMALWLVRKAKG